MKELEYPFDAGEILRKKKKIRRKLLEEKQFFLKKNIAILGGSTTSEIKNMMELFLLNCGIRPQFYESEYNRFFEDAVFPNPELEAFKPDVIYIHTTNRNVTAFPDLRDSADAVSELIEGEIKKYISIWAALRERYGCPIIQNNFEMPLYRLLGNKDASDIHGAVNFITRLNLKFYEYAQEHSDFFICDINYLSADYGLKEWSDPLFYHLYKYAVSIQAIPYLAFNVSNIIKSLFGQNKKGLVLDLDNTLWGGAIGEEGVEGIKIGPEEPEGRVFLEFQKYVKAQKQLGIVLAIDSKNDLENAIVGLRHPNCILAPEDFTEIRANWEPKDRNLEDIASALQMLPESLVFIDDNPAERHIVESQLPGVTVPELGESHQYIQNIDRNGFFEVTALSEDDLKRTKMYEENARRAQMRASFSDYGEYLKSLKMQAVIRPFETIYMDRIAQLTNKTNQFNLTTRRYTRSQLEEITSNKNYITLYGKLEDRFGDNGVVSVVVGHIVGHQCDIDLWLMSCRVLKRDMECALMDALVKKCQEKKISALNGFYYPTGKNKMVRDFYMRMGFEKLSEDQTGNSKWLFKIPDTYKRKNMFIEVEELP